MEERTKYQKISKLQKNWILTKICNDWITVRELSKNYNISKSTLYRIKNDSRLVSKPDSMRDIFKFKKYEKEKLVNCIKEYLKYQKSHFNAEDVSKFVDLKLSNKYPIYMIRNIMKQQLNLSYKRINSRPLNVDFERLLLSRIIFSMHISKIINDDILLINIDEAWLNKETKANYSWVSTGMNGESQNINLANTMNIVLAIWSYGSWLEILSNNTLNEDRFIFSLKNLKIWLDENNCFGYSKILILLDNLASHRTNKVIDYWAKSNIKLCFIPPYSPTLAPVELAFWVLKRKLVAKNKNCSTNLNNYEGYRLVIQWMREIDNKIIRNCYSHFYWELKKNISNISFSS